jgi:serine/threonine-protein kinase
MATVYEGTHAPSGQRVAIKVLHPQYRAEGQAGGYSFQREREVHELLAETQHPNLVSHVDSGLHFIASEKLEGVDLATCITHDALPPLVALDFLAQALDGLEIVHGHGLVHRDIKPDNLFLAHSIRTGQVVKVLDYGLAIAMNNSAADPNNGLIVGTPSYMSPEQAQGLRLDARSDLYALGGVLYVLITRHVLHDTGSTEDLLRLMEEDAVNLRRDPLLTEVDYRVRRLLERMLCMNPDGRPASAEALAKEMRALIEDLKRPTPLVIDYVAPEASGATREDKKDGGAVIEQVPTPADMPEPNRSPLAFAVTLPPEAPPHRPPTDNEPPPRNEISSLGLILVGVLVGAITGVAAFGGWTLMFDSGSDRAVAVLPRPVPTQRHVPSPTVRAPDLAPSQPSAPPLPCWSRRGAGRNLPFLRIGDRKVARDPRCWELTPPAERAHTCRHLRRRHYETSPRFHGYCDGY